MKIKSVKANLRKKSFEVETTRGTYEFPFSRIKFRPDLKNPISDVFVDKELGSEAFTFILSGGKETSVHVDQILEYHQDSNYLREMILYKMTVQAQKLIRQSGLKRREIIRRMKTTPTQFYRLIDQSYFQKTVDQMIKLLAALDCQVDLVFQKAA